MSDAAQSLAYVKSAIATLPDELGRALSAELPVVSGPAQNVVTTGIGASEGPARMLAFMLAQAGVCARFCATSQFASPDESELPAGDLLVVFSQGLSPTARLCKHGAQRFAARWLVTSVDTRTAAQNKCDELAAFQRCGFVPVVVPPVSEPSLLVRLIGSCVASLVALRLCAHLTSDRALSARLQQAPQAYRNANPPARLGNDPALALVTLGVANELAYGHRWKLLEALLRCDPPVWDALQFAHGPLQAFHDKALTLLVLERGQGSPLLPRFQRVLRPELHRVIHIPSQHTDVLSFFEHSAALDALFLAELVERPRNLFDWPARHGDEPLYGLSGP